MDPLQGLPVVVDDRSPCFFWQRCKERAAIEKAGRAVCLECARRLRGSEYPLRRPTNQPLYLTGRALAEQMDMLDEEVCSATDGS